MHQRADFFGFTPDEPPQPRWHKKVDIDVAMEASAEVYGAFFNCLAWPDQPPFSGGVLDAWPNRMAQGLAFARREWAAIQSHLSHENKGAKRNG